MRLIDADALKEAIKDSILYHKGPLYWKEAVSTLIECINKEEITPTIDPVKHGHWDVINTNFVQDQKLYECSICRKSVSLNAKMKYCYCCGARMDEEDE